MSAREGMSTMKVALNSTGLARASMALFCAVVAAAFVDAAPDGDPDPSAAVVKLYVTTVARDLAAPWRPGVSFETTGSGAAIGGPLVLTAAHVVNDATFVRVRRNGTATRATARVVFVSHLADLALVEVADPAFFDGVKPLSLGGLPAVQEEVRAYGFPNGGETLSITRGVVARVEHERYVHGGESLLAIQMDAAIAPGSSGGPVIEDGRLVGVAMQGFKESAIGCAVPAPVIRQFLEDVADGRLDGIPALAIEHQKLENAALKASLRVPEGGTGVLVRKVGEAAGGVLQPGDVLLALAGRAVADDGTVEFRPRERTELEYVTDVVQVGSKVPVRYLREGRVQEATLELGRARGEGRLVPRLFDRAADYYLYGGLAFVTLSQNLLEYATKWTPPRIAVLGAEEAQDHRQEVVLLAWILTSEVNSGYSDERWNVVEDVDGESVASLAQLVRAVEAPSSDPFVSFGLSGGYRVTIDRARAAASSREVLARYGIAADRSARLAETLATRASGAAPTPGVALAEAGR